MAVEKDLQISRSVAARLASDHPSQHSESGDATPQAQCDDDSFFLGDGDAGSYGSSHPSDELDVLEEDAQEAEDESQPDAGDDDGSDLGDAGSSYHSDALDVLEEDAQEAEDEAQRDTGDDDGSELLSCFSALESGKSDSDSDSSDDQASGQSSTDEIEDEEEQSSTDESSDSESDSDEELAKKVRAQLRLESFAGQPSLSDPLPEELDLTYRILHTLQTAGAPLSCFDDIVKLTRRAREMQAPMPPTSRKKAMKDLCERFHQEELKPSRDNIQLPSGGSVDITTFDFAAALGSLLADPVLMQDKHLQFYETADGSPLGCPPSELPTVLNDVLDGDVCRGAYMIYVKTSNGLLVPIIFFIDKTHCDNNQRLTLEPLCFTLAIFKKEFRRLPQFWRTLGFVNTYRDSKEQLSPVQKAADYHCVLGHLLASYKEAQQMDLKWNLMYKGVEYRVVLHIPLLMVIGDTEGHDRLCLHYQNRTHSKMLCRYCCCPTADTDNPNAKYTKTRGPYIDALVRAQRKEKLKSMSYHCVLSAFYGVLFCDPTRGINGATPMEMLHVLQHGLYQYGHIAISTAKKEMNPNKKRKQPSGSSIGDNGDCEQVENETKEEQEEDEDDDKGPTVPPVELLSEFKQAQNKSDSNVFPQGLRKEVNISAKKYGRLLVHQSDREYKRAHFDDGIFGVACKQGHEERMILVLFLVLFCSSEFPRFKKAFGSEERLSLYVLVISHFLMIEDFMKVDRCEREDIIKVGLYMPRFLEMFKRACDRSTGMGTKIIKFHLLTHFAEDVLRFGPSTGYDSSFCESMHKVYKKDARRTQRRLDASFQFQTATRSCERIAIACGMRSILAREAPPIKTMIHVRIFGKNSVIMTQHTTRNQMTRALPFLDWQYLRKLGLERDINVFPLAEIRGVLYRAEWTKGRFDWAYVRWETFGQSVVSRFKCFFELREGERIHCHHADIEYLQPGMYGLVEAFRQDYNVAPPDDESIDNYQAHTATSLIYRMDLARDAFDTPQLFLVDLGRMVDGPAAVVPFDLSQTSPMEWLVLSPKNERVSIFRDNMTEMMEQPT